MTDDLKDRLFKSRLEEDTVDVPGVGALRVRALSRADVLAVRDAADPAAAERKILVAGVVDPKLTEADVRKWQAASAAGEIEEVTDRIAELSGLGDRPDRAAEARFQDES